MGGIMMEVITTKLKFIAIIFIGMVSLLLIGQRVSYHKFIFHYINKSIQNSIVINSNSFDGNSSLNQISFIDSITDVLSESHYTNYSVNTTNFLNKRKENIYFNNEINLIKQKVLNFETKYLVPKKRPQNSKLLYTDVIKDITVMTIGDKNCDINYGKELKVVIIVISRVDGFKRRSIIRETWAKRILESKHVKLYFAIGLTQNTETQQMIELENKEFNDLLQWNFIDNYYNLTIKSLGILRWVTLNCFNAKFIYKVDDDCIVNYENLIKFSEKATQKTIYGYLWKKAFVDRHRNHKFFISRSDYKFNSYPDYTGGPWLMSATVVPLLYETAITKSLPALPYEDVYITGVIASKAGIERKHLSGLVFFSHSMFNRLNYCWFNENIIFWQNLDDLMLTNGWKNIEISKKFICLTNNSYKSHF